MLEAHFTDAKDPWGSFFLQPLPLRVHKAASYKLLCVRWTGSSVSVLTVGL